MTGLTFSFIVISYYPGTHAIIYYAAGQGREDEMKKVRYFSFSLNLVILLAAGLLSCGGGGGTVSAGAPAPYIYAEVLSLPSSTLFPEIQNVYVFVQDDTDGTLIDTAAVLVNGVTITYDNASLGYVGTVAISPGSSIQMTVTVAGQSYGVTSTQFSSYPMITSPASGALWSASRDHVVQWTGGLPATGATYGLGVLDAADPNGNLLWPSSGYLQDIPVNTTSFTLPAYSLTTGDRVVLAGIWREGTIPGAASGSSIIIGGFSAAPIKVINASSDVITSIAVTPINPLIATGDTIQMVATATFDDSTSLNVTNLVMWSSIGAAVPISSAGLASGISAGTTTVTASSGVSSGSTEIRAVPGFDAGTNYAGIPFGANLADTAVGDLNGDGRNDVAVLDWYGAHIYLYYQNAGGTFNAPQTLTTDLYVRGVVIKDVNNDGFADLIVSGNSTTALSGPLGRVAVYRQSPTDNTLGVPEYPVLSIDDVGPPAVGDLNSDNLPDIVTAGTGTGGSGTLSFLFQGSGGMLMTEVTYTGVSVYSNGPASAAHGEIHVGDMNSDGKNDVVLQSGLTEIAVIRQTAAGVFSATPDLYTVQTSYWPYFKSFALGDLNGDGRTDIAVADPGNGGMLNLFIRNNAGSFDRTIMQGGALDVQDEVDIADMDGDGLNDLIILSFGDRIQIYYQAVDHSFMGPLMYWLPTQGSGGTFVHQALTTGDVNNDNLPDIVASWSTEGVFVLPRKP